MAGYAYLDASALVKLAVHEPESAALEAAVRQRDALITSTVGAIELQRALARTRKAGAIEQASAVLDAMFLADVTAAVRSRAGRLEPASLRTLDAIHVATALSLVLPDLEFVTYDDRQAAAARACGLSVVQPGR
jgi:predicted nucleic acid-binding protein